MALAPLISAVHLLPGAEFAAASVRGGDLSAMESNTMTTTWTAFRQLLASRLTGVGTSLSVIVCCIAGSAILHRSRNRTLAFYGLLWVLFLVLCFDNVISKLYRQLPLTAMFRGPDRFLWPADFCLSILVGFGTNALVSGQFSEGAQSRFRPFILLVGAGVYWLLAGGFRPLEWLLLFGLISAVMLASWKASNRMSDFAIIGTLLMSLMVLARSPLLGFLADARVELTSKRPVFDAIAPRAGEERRVLALGKNADFSIMQKSPTIFGLQGVGDYEPMTSRRYAEFYVKMVIGNTPAARMVNLNQFYFQSNLVPRNRVLVNLTAMRFLAVDDALNDSGGKIATYSNIGRIGSTTLYENEQALPRALFVPRVAVVSDAQEMLNALSSPAFPVGTTALIEAPPVDGFYGSSDDVGSAEITLDHSELVSVRVFSGGGGFLFLADQFYPGWYATVNEKPAPILRANYAFRAVRVPPGQSEVVFRYRPKSLEVGLGVTVTTLAGLLLLLTAAPAERFGRSLDSG
jgi:hypothetical protein